MFLLFGTKPTSASNYCLAALVRFLRTFLATRSLQMAAFLSMSLVSLDPSRPPFPIPVNRGPSSLRTPSSYLSIHSSSSGIHSAHPLLPLVNVTLWRLFVGDPWKAISSPHPLYVHVPNTKKQILRAQDAVNVSLTPFATESSCQAQPSVHSPRRHMEGSPTTNQRTSGSEGAQTCRASLHCPTGHRGLKFKTEEPRVRGFPQVGVLHCSK